MSVNPHIDKIYNLICAKIDDKSLVCEDLDNLIKESLAKGIQDRVQRRTRVTATEPHIDSETGHQKLSSPNMKGRVVPKRKPPHPMSHGRSKAGNRRSQRTQAASRAAEGPFAESIDFIKRHIGKPLNESDLTNINKLDLHKVATKMMALPNIDRDWLFDLCKKIGDNNE
jgi:hypothetical protein